uniref:Uncharacterized protein n=2 Tax=Physcomitrium patens TaxID=3218 RepID=A0A7I4E8F8_PHYPA
MTGCKVRRRPCKDRRNCRRRVYLFADTLEQLRLLSMRAQYSLPMIPLLSPSESPPWSPRTVEEWRNIT